MSKQLMAALMAGASLSILAGQALAQDADTTEVQELVVTGTRIIRDGYTAPTPVTVAPVAEIQKTTPSNIPDALNKLPQFTNSLGPARSSHNFANGADHGNVLNLRGLGGARTLVLFDGQRVPPTTYKGTVDTNVIPNLLVSRVEIVTGGASAAYGSDAVSGVVNFVLDRDFKGLKGQAQYGVDDHGDNQNYRIGVAAGAPFADGKGHVLLSGEYFDSKGMLRSDRKRGRTSWAFVGSNPACVTAATGACVPGGANNPYTIGQDVRITSASQLGKIVAAPAGFTFLNYRFTADGQLVQFANGTTTGSPGIALGGDGYSIPTDTTAVTPLKTFQTYGRVSYEVTPDISAYLQASFTQSDLSYVSLANSFVTPTTAPLFSGNPYLPAAIQSQLAAGQSISLARYGGQEVKPRTKEQTQFWQVSAGLEGKLGAWNWDANFNHADSRYNVDQKGLWDWKKTYAAIDAVRDPASGAIVCRPLLDADPAIRAQYAGCQPLNLLVSGPAFYNQAGYAYATGTSSFQADNIQDSVSFNIHGPVFDLPAGSVDVAFGAEYRRQKLDLNSNADPAGLDTAAERNAYFAGLRGVAPSALYYWLTNVGEAHGKENVKEAYGEIAVPILKDAPFAQELSLNGAARVTDYSTSGTVWTWKAGGTWKPVDDVLFRYTLSRDIRAPNLFELFAGDQSAISLLTDPISGGPAQNVPQVNSGNALLTPEIAKTQTIGAVLQPRFAPGFSMSVDYYKVRIKDAIGTLGLQQIVNNCAANAGAPECDLITRSSPTAFPTQVRVAPANIAFQKTKGIDFDASYRREVGPGNLALRLYATRLLKFESQTYSGAAVLDFTGVNVVASNPLAYPKWRGTFTADYSWNNLGVTISEQYIGKMTLGIPGQPQNFVNPNVPSVWYTDLAVRYDIKPGGRDLQLFATVQNLFDKQAPLIPGITPGVNLPTNNAIYDIIGRTYTMGLRFKF